MRHGPGRHRASCRVTLATCFAIAACEHPSYTQAHKHTQMRAACAACADGQMGKATRARRLTQDNARHTSYAPPYSCLVAGRGQFVAKHTVSVAHNRGRPSISIATANQSSPLGLGIGAFEHLQTLEEPPLPRAYEKGTLGPPFVLGIGLGTRNGLTCCASVGRP